MMNENHGEISTWDDQRGDSGELIPREIEDDCWDVFLPDEDQRDLLPEPGDFWIEDDLLELRRSAA